MCASTHPPTNVISLADLPQKVIHAIIPHAGDPFTLRLISKSWNEQVLEYLTTNKKPLEAVYIVCWKDKVYTKMRVDENHLTHFGASKWGRTGERGPGENVVKVFAPGQSVVRSLIMDPLRSLLDECSKSSINDIFLHYPYRLFLQCFYLPVFLFLSLFLLSTGNLNKIQALEREFQSRPRAREERGRWRMKRLFESCSRIGVLRVMDVDRKTLDILRDCLEEVKIGRVEVQVKRSMFDFPRNEEKYLGIIAADVKELAQKHGVASGVFVNGRAV